ncbi:MAG TPA: hypothetical protein VNL18_16605 [Gemmatimonadales bacterium]|nr:hypothetical protein [Gemmatimonadales bacterium]
MKEAGTSDRIPRAGALAVMLAGIGCDSANVIGPENQLEVTNAADNFQWQGTLNVRVQKKP